MSDPLSLAASITGIVAIGLYITHVVAQFVGDTRSAPKSIRSLGVELEILCNILEKVRTMAEGCTPHAPVLQSHVLVQILEGMKVDFEDLSEILGAHTSTPSDSALRQGWKQVRWVFRESEVADLRRSIEAYKSSLLLTLTFAKQYESRRRPLVYLLMMAGTRSESLDRRTAENIFAEMAATRKDLADVRALCHQLRNRNRGLSRLATQSSSLHQLRANTSTVSLTVLTSVATGQPTASAQSGFSTRSNRSASSITSIASSYWAASIIDLYCTELEDISAQSPVPQSPVHEELASGTPDTPISSTVRNHTLQLAQLSSLAGESSRRPARSFPTFFRSSTLTATWQFPFPQPTRETCVPVIMPTTAATDNIYHFNGMLFYPAPKLAPGAFTPVPGPHATVVEQDEYVRRSVEQNAGFLLRKSPNDNEMKDSLGIMKLFWRCHALYRLDPLSDAIRGFSSPGFRNNPSANLLRTYRFQVPDLSPGTLE